MSPSKYIRQLKHQRNQALSDNETLNELWQYELKKVTQLEVDNAQLHNAITQLVTEGLKALRGVEHGH